MNNQEVHRKVLYQREIAGEGGQQSSQEGGSQSSQGEENQSSQGGEKKDKISVTEMKDKSILNIDTEDIKWDTMSETIENINASWSVMMLDLNNSNVFQDEVIAFSNILDNSIISIKNKDKKSTLNNLTNLYSYVPKFLTLMSAEKHTQNIETTKYNIFVAYSAATQDDWDTVNTSLTNAENSFSNLVNDTEYSKNNEYKLNKTNMIIKDLKNSSTNKDKTLFFLKYKNLMQSLNIF